MRNKTVTSTSPAHEKVMGLTGMISFFLLLPTTHIRILGSFFLSKISSMLSASLASLITSMQHFLLCYTKSDSFFPQKSVSFSYVTEKQELSFIVVVCTTTIFPFKLFLSLKAKYRWKSPHFLLITDVQLMLYFYIAKSVYYILSHVR